MPHDFPLNTTIHNNKKKLRALIIEVFTAGEFAFIFHIVYCYYEYSLINCLLSFFSTMAECFKKKSSRKLLTSNVEIIEMHENVKV